jgi:DNA-binding transcriptional ArsR family regulator
MALRAAVEAAPAYELVLSMASPRPLAKVAGPGLAAQLSALGHGSDYFWAHLLSVAIEAPPPRDAEAFLAHLEAIDPSDLRLRLAGYQVRWFRRFTPPEVMLKALRGDRRAAEAFLATSEPQDPAWQAALGEILSSTAATLKSRVLNLAWGWYRAVGPALEREQPMLRQEAARQRARGPRISAVDLIAAVAGVEYVPEPGIERVILIPSLAIRPELHVFDHLQLKIICYPLDVPRRDAWSPPTGLTGLVKSLADERRLSMVRLLAGGPLSAQQIAGQLGIPITTALHHLAILRSSGVLRGGRGRGRTYLLDRTLRARVQAGLEDLLTTATGRAGLTTGR